MKVLLPMCVERFENLMHPVARVLIKYQITSVRDKC
jgi:hypothetical protein